MTTRKLLHSRPTLGVLAGWQFYRTATNLSYLLPVFGGINRAAHEMGCNLLFGCGMGASASPSDPPRPAWPSAAADVDFVPIGPANTDGLLIFTPLHSGERSAYIQNLVKTGHPILFIGTGEDGPTLAADNRGGIFEAMEHLVRHGHQRIAFVAGSSDDLAGDTGERLAAYHAAVELYNLPTDPRLVTWGRHVFDGGYLAMQQILNTGAQFSAVLASNDESALGAIQALKDAGRSIPQDVAVIGFDNRQEGAVQTSSLTSVHVPLSRLGYQAVHLLLKQIEARTDHSTGQNLNVSRVATRLIVRQSCGCQEIAEIDSNPPTANVLQAMTLRVMGKAQNLAESDCLSCCRRLWAAFDASVQNHSPAVFLQVLDGVLAQTTAVDDDAHIWQDALSILEQIAGPDSGPALITPARIAISERMQQQHYHYMIRQRWVNSRLSLLTASLLTALDEEQIYTILEQHLPAMNIHMARIALFENRMADAAPSIKVRNVLNLQQPPTVIPSFDFPPQDIIPSDQPFHLALIPLTDPNGQLGFAIFGNEYFELYGAIVQQLGGALNTANLYRLATEGRRLAEEANRMKSRFLSTISHELRTPLNLIMGLSGMVLEASDQSDSPLPEAIQKDMERVHAYSQHLGGLIGDVLDLATSDAGELRLNLEPLDLIETLRIVAESGRQLSADKGLAWEDDLPEYAIWVNGDRTRLRQVALNLINNAIKFTEHGSIRLQIKLDAPGFVRVQVTDTGLGIPLPEQESIFAEFRQSERSVALGYGGMGLGLAISRRLVEMHAGNIGVFSSGKEGAGSTFYFTLPTAVYNGDQAVKLLSDHKAGRNIVMLTRSPVASEQMRKNLARRGIHVQVLLVSSPADWQSQIQETLPDAILLDVSVASDLDWRNLKSLRRQKASPVPVLFFNTSEDNGSVLEMDYLTKPIELSELTRALDQHWLMADANRQQRTVLVVEDDPNTLEMHARIVQSHSRDNRVLTARNGREALAVLQQEVVDLVLLDLQMPEMDGFAVLQAMREKEDLLKIPVIVVTGKVLHEADMARLNQGVTAVLGKGLFSLEETVTHITSALERKRRLSGEAQRLVRKAMAYIHEHFADPISRKEIAQYVSISEDHLTFCFRQETGATPIDYLQRFRVSEAKRLLKDTDRTITEIALDVGFSDSGYFSRIFRRSTGKSPEAFRRSG